MTFASAEELKELQLIYLESDWFLIESGIYMGFKCMDHLMFIIRWISNFLLIFLYMVTELYTGNKASEMLESLIEFWKMSKKEKLEFAAASWEDESISLHYKKYLAASLMLQEDAQRWKDHI